MGLYACDDARRAGSLYNPMLQQKMLAEKNKPAIVKTGVAVQTYHSALGDFCTHYKDNNAENLVCDSGTTEQQVRILQ